MFARLSRLATLAASNFDLPGELAYQATRVTPYVLGTILVLTGISGGAVGFAMLFEDRRFAGACPEQSARLNPWEYELQKRTCEAVAHGALTPR